MKKTLLFISLLTLLALGARPANGPLKRLTVINKSGMDIAIRLTGSDSENFYYLRIPAADRTTPTAKVFTVVRDRYSSTLYYIELWDPVYGFSCSSMDQILDITRNVKVIVSECDRIFPNAGEPPAIIKFGFSESGIAKDGKKDRR
jgi:hypothetical protein